VAKLSQKLWVLVPGLVLWIGLCLNGPSASAARPGPPTNRLAQLGPSFGQKPSLTSSITSSFKRGIHKLTKALTPKTPVKPADDPVSLESTATPGPQLYVAVGRLYEQSGKLPEAEQQYRKALQAKPDSLSALLAYARLKDRQNQLDQATKLYRQAAKAHPDQAPVFNNLGLCYAQRGMPGDSLAALGRAIQLEPKNPLYRNNIATVLVEMGRTREAYGHLRAVHDGAAAYYNLGYLLNKKGQKQAAVDHFAMALRIRPSMVQAKQWIQRLQRSGVQAHAPRSQPTGPVRLRSRTGPPRRTAPAALAPPQPHTHKPPVQRVRSHGGSSGDREPAVRQLPPPPKRYNRQTSRATPPQPAPQTPNVPPMPPETSIPRRLPPTGGGWAAPPTLPPLSKELYRRQPTRSVPPVPRPHRRPVIQPLPRVR